ncbi:hypothetical protein [Niastella sp. OAS944]|uniref:hypothetical protein n=1 Tax=Niastella sp. OAS944 TaxID=2664089 RepID=UPI0034878302|nr:hypothetical protein [Chitinophagaceae bacterium OAS944]
MAYHQPFEISAFHSCDREVGLRILNGEDDLIASENEWDWLGPGIYFWEQNPGRALEYAIECASGWQKNKTRIKTPFVIGAIIELGNCLNLLEPGSIEMVKKAYDKFAESCVENGKSIPVNKGPIRKLDCSVIKCLHASTDENQQSRFDTVRSAFNEGGQIYPNSNFYDRLHIEICVRNPTLIKGYFLPRPIGEFNPYLKKQYSF